MKNKVTGKIIQAVGPIVDVSFKDQHLPELLTALEVQLPNDKKLRFFGLLNFHFAFKSA